MPHFAATIIHGSNTLLLLKTPTPVFLQSLKPEPRDTRFTKPTEEDDNDNGDRFLDVTLAGWRSGREGVKGTRPPHLATQARPHTALGGAIHHVLRSPAGPSIWVEGRGAVHLMPTPKSQGQRNHPISLEAASDPAPEAA